MDTMSTMMTAMGQNPGYMTSAGAGMKLGGTIGQGLAAKSAAGFEAQQYQRKAAEDAAAGANQAQNAAERTAQVAGAAKARAAASGGSGGSLSDIMAGIAAKGKTQQQMDIWSGRTAANADIARANAAKSYGKNALYGSILQGVGDYGKTMGTTLPKLGSQPAIGDSVTDADSGDTIISNQQRRRYG